MGTTVSKLMSRSINQSCIWLAENHHRVCTRGWVQNSFPYYVNKHSNSFVLSEKKFHYLKNNINEIKFLSLVNIVKLKKKKKNRFTAKAKRRFRYEAKTNKRRSFWLVMIKKKKKKKAYAVTTIQYVSSICECGPHLTL